ncbi:MAG: hypothetical protein QOH72_3426 [Solirubrobacteraceae bacterium]|jgi:hypothetical protein|nr:hypothetical protein [Solirubrobacteraceae bacterium]
MSIDVIQAGALRHHGGVRGATHAPASSSFEGRFGRMFRGLPPARFQEEDLLALGKAMTADADAPTDEHERDDEENPAIEAGYTYLGQFIDHDLTFDPASSLQRRDDPDALTDFRTPRFDLDCIYGRGPSDQPYLYQEDGIQLLLGEPLSGNAADPHAADLPRNSLGRALIGDPRNDENRLVAQLQLAMLRFHNLMASMHPDAAFEEVQQQVRWHYQWIVLHDFLPTIVKPEAFDAVFPHGPARPPELRFFHWRNAPFIPIEFSAAAYRFGHSMIRPIYRFNETVERRPIFSATPNESSADLGGFRPIPDDWAIDWRFFFLLDAAPQIGRPQQAYKPDTSVVNPLGALPPSIATDPSSLPQRNLLRGWRMGLPSGQAVARAMGEKVLAEEKLVVGKAIESDQPGTPLARISPRLAGNAPLWYYVLAEAQSDFEDNDTPLQLKGVGGRIVAETFAGLLWGDRHSYLRQDPGFAPLASLSRNGEFGMVELIRSVLEAT